jgi:hypothetical protein
LASDDPTLGALALRHLPNLCAILTAIFVLAAFAPSAPSMMPAVLSTRGESNFKARAGGDLGIVAILILIVDFSRKICC